MTHKSLLSRPRILDLKANGEIVIEPFDERNVGTNSYDVTLGKHFWRELQPGEHTNNLPAVKHGLVCGTLYNMYDEAHVNKLWLRCEANAASVVLPSVKLEGIEPDDLIILVGPGEAILAHTEEFIGGRSNRITSVMKARSTVGRNFLEVSRCAGVGDVGYCNRWTLEITNNSRWHAIPLVVGRRVGQLLFYEVDPIEGAGYTKDGKYQQGTLEEAQQQWSPQNMIPRAYLDREVVGAQPEEPTMPEETKPHKLSVYTVKRGRNRPATMSLQMLVNELARRRKEPSWALDEDGAFGGGTEKIVKEVQGAFSLSKDGAVGSGTWATLTGELLDWRAPIMLRIAECQCSFESGSKGFEYCGIITAQGVPQEEWFNYGIWNTNRGSARSLMQMGGAPSSLRDRVAEVDRFAARALDAAKSGDMERCAELLSQGRDEASEIAAWFGSRAGRETQIDSYLLEKTIKPSIKNLVRAGFKYEDFGVTDLDFDEFPTKLAPFYERLLALSCDITVNSGPGGFFPHKSPRKWQSQGSLAWPEDRLPDREACKAIYSEEFGEEIPHDNIYVTADSSEPYTRALSRCLWELCDDDEQRISLIAELQSRCIVPRWQDMVIRRRRCVAWKDGHTFQGSFYCMPEDFGVGA